MMLALLLGALGGAAVTIVALLTQVVPPIRTYLAFSDQLIGNCALFGWLFRLLVLTCAGALWVKLNREIEPLKALQLGIGAPAAIAGLLGIAPNPGSDDFTLLRNTDPIRLQYFDAFYVGLLGQPLKFVDSLAASISDSTGTSAPSTNVEAPIADDLATRFYSSERRVLSDGLSSLYKTGSPAEKNAIVEALIGALQANGDGKAYRVNIYVARTLALTNGWNGTAKQRSAIENLAHSVEYKDDTFKSWIDRALQTWKPY